MLLLLVKLGDIFDTADDAEDKLLLLLICVLDGVVVVVVVVELFTFVLSAEIVVVGVAVVDVTETGVNGLTVAAVDLLLLKILAFEEAEVEIEAESGGMPVGL